MKLKFLSKIATIVVVAVTLLSCDKNSDNGADFGSTKVTLKDIDTNAEVKGMAADGVSTLIVDIPEFTTKTLLTLEIKHTGTPWGEFAIDREFSIPSSDIIVESPAADFGIYRLYFRGELTLPEQLTTGGSVVDKVFDVTATFTDGEIFETSFTIEIIRPAVVFAHGLASSAETFDPILSVIEPMNIFIDEALYALDYSQTSLSTYETNTYVVPNAIEEVMDRVSEAGYVNKKVSVVGHSMGGVLTRLYMQGELYRGDILNFISIDVPHSGSQLADFALDITTDAPSDNPIAKIVNKGAIFDLQVDSEATLVDLNGESLNAVTVPTHIIASTIGTLPNITSLIRDKEYFEAVMTFVLSSFSASYLYNGDDSDIVVPLQSQLGGVTASVAENPITEYNDQWHCSVLTSTETANTIVDVLNDQAKTDRPPFTTEGFNPPVLAYNSSLNSVQIVELQDNNIPDIQAMELIGYDAYNNIVDMKYSESGYFEDNFDSNPKVVTTQIFAQSASSPQTFYYKTVE